MQPAEPSAWQFAVLLFSRPLASTVMPAPSYAPISVGSCSSSDRLPFRFEFQPMIGSSGIGSTADWDVPFTMTGAIGALHWYVLVGSYGAPGVGGVAVGSPLMMGEAAATPCSRTGFHISSPSLYLPGPTMIMSPGAAVSSAF